MPATSGDARLYHLGWRANGDGFDVALAINRLLAAGARAWRASTASPGLDAGDYLVELTLPQHRAITDLGLTVAPWMAPHPTQAEALSSPATCLFAGTASKFPYYAYYALCLLRLGVDYTPCSGAELAHGVLADANLLVLPGGFSTWGIDNAEDAPGADANVRAFLGNGGVAVGSCGGAFYLSAGRPAWTGTAAAKPLYTHEYLQSGVGVVALALTPGPLATGCPPTMEVPYYHGPIYDLMGPGIEVAATFHALTLPGGLSIDNPLDHDKFARDMAGKPAVLLADGVRGRAVLFSPHPEMGDLIRKYIAVDGYVRHYLPIRGFGTLRDTLRHYRVADAPSFRLVLNAIHTLMTSARPARSVATARDAGGGVTADDVVSLCWQAYASLPDLGAGEQGELLRDVAAGLGARIEPAGERAARALAHAGHLGHLLPCWRHLAATMADRLATSAPRAPAEALMELELAIALLECWTRVAGFDLALAGVRERSGAPA